MAETLRVQQPERDTSRQFGWKVPRLDDGVTVTVSRTQFAPQADRLGILAQLSQASTIGEFANNLRGILTRPVAFPTHADREAGIQETAPAQQKRQFFELLFGANPIMEHNSEKRKGVISPYEIAPIIRRMKGILLREPSQVKTVMHTREELMQQAREATGLNKRFIEEALESFDAQATTTYVDSKGNMHDSPEKTYKIRPAVRLPDGYVQVGEIMGMANIIKQNAITLEKFKGQISAALIATLKANNVDAGPEIVTDLAEKLSAVKNAGDMEQVRFQEICDVLGIPSQDRTAQGIQKALEGRSEKKIFNLSGTQVETPEDAYTVRTVVPTQVYSPKVIETVSPSVPPTDARNILDTTFSAANRSAGSKIAGVPATVIDRNITGIEVKDRNDFSSHISGEYEYGDKKGSNNFALFGREVRIGQPYAERMEVASMLVTQAVDIVARKLDEFIDTQRELGRETVPVEEAAEHALQHVDSWLQEPGAFQYRGVRSRTHLQMDYYFLPSRDVRKTLIDDANTNNGFLSDEARAVLNQETQNGNLRLTIFDISGGAGGTGVSEFIAQNMGYETSGLTDAYINSLLNTYEAKMGREAQNIVLCPRRDDLTIMAFEYAPLVQELKNRGKDAYIVLAEDLEEALQTWDGQSEFSVTTLDGQTISPELIAKRFTFLGAGKKREGDRGHIRTNIPEGVVILPSPASRIPASDKRINSRILEVLEPALNEIGVEVVPTKVLEVVNRQRIEALDHIIQHGNEQQRNDATGVKKSYIAEAATRTMNNIIEFAQSQVEQWPEISHLGLVLKIDDKRPGREGKGGELVSAYPVYAGIVKASPDNRTDTERQIDNTYIDNPDSSQEVREYAELMLKQKIMSLINKGALSILVQPNLLTAFGTGEDFMETKMLVYADQQ